jgi:hypothetical protein
MEKRVRYMARPAIAEERLALLPDGSIRLQLKTSWRDGTQFLLFTPSEFIEKLIALVPLPKFHLTRYYGVFAKASKYRDKLPDRYAIDVLQCSQCKLGRSRMRRVAVICDSPTIQTTLTAMGISPRPPPIAPPKRTRLWGEGKTLEAWDRNGFDVSESDNASNRHPLIDGDFYPD